MTSYIKNWRTINFSDLFQNAKFAKFNGAPIFPVLQHSAGNRKLIFSPDTDVYHIGLTNAFIASDDIIILLSPIGHELKLLHLNELDLALQFDSNLQSIPPHKRKEILQVLYVLTGCDFTSFSLAFVKLRSIMLFYCYSIFINFRDQHTPGTISDVSAYSNGFLSFVRPIGVAYFMKHCPAFQVDTPIGYFKSYFTASCTPEEYYKQWYDGTVEAA